MNTVRIRRRPSPRGKTAAVVLIVLAVICAIVGLAGGYFAMQGVQGFMKIMTDLTSADTPLLVSPGELKVTGGPGVIFVAARGSETVDGTSFSYPPSDGAVSITVTSPSGATISPEQQQGNATFPSPDGNGVTTLVGVYEMKESGEYKVAATGGATALRVRTFTGKDATAIMSSATSAGGGFLGGLCGCGGALVFGLIGGILLLFGGKKTAAPA
jgi:hypothetical protein